MEFVTHVGTYYAKSVLTLTQNWFSFVLCFMMYPYKLAFIDRVLECYHFISKHFHRNIEI